MRSLRRPDESPSDTELLERLGAGDVAALEALLQRFWPQLLRYLEATLGSADAAQDVAQDTFCRLWERRTQWRVEGSVRGLIFRVAHNLAISAHRSRQAEARAVHAIAAQARLTVVNAAASSDRELRAALERAVAALPLRRREVFVLRCVHDLSYREIAEIMGTSVQTVANQLSHALASLRASLAHLIS
jgi:RNA polymerase sigma-70 factor, ECF subfamily